MKYKLPDKNRALENLARILGYLDKDKNKEQDGISKLAEALTSLASRLPT